MKTLTLLIAISAFSLSLAAQSKQEAAEAASILWFGLDFSEARFVGKQDFKSPEELKEKFIPSWNKLMLSEPEKYNIAEFFHKAEVLSDFGDVYARNGQIDETQILLGVDGIGYEIPEEKIQEIISSYVTDYDGYGLVLIIENFNKLKVTGSMWVTIFHIPSKTVVLTKRVSAEPSGFGLRNYWAGSIYEALKESSGSLDKWLAD